MKSADDDDFCERGFCPTSSFFFAGVSGFFLAAAPPFTGGAGGCFFLESFFGFPIVATAAAADPFAGVLPPAAPAAVGFGTAAPFDFLSMAAFAAAGFGAGPFLTPAARAFLAAGFPAADLPGFAGFDFSFGFILAADGALRAALASDLAWLAEFFDCLAFVFPWPFAAALVV
ncbi:MAG: hypothetical protein WD076_00730, partial [Parvularculaceae bacterium]